ncbi:MAG TPA: STAS domain-containing protein [Streptosporangiaceae bacterium]|nr:STAS domain-containing protein [Streptosporangiaceae bacterium]
MVMAGVGAPAQLSNLAAVGQPAGQPELGDIVSGIGERADHRDRFPGPVPLGQPAGKLPAGMIVAAAGPPAQLISLVAASQGGVQVMTLPAELDHGSAEQAGTALARALAGGATVLIADMTATAYCSLEGVHALLRARAAASAAGAQLRLAAVQPVVRRVLKVTGASILLHPFPTVSAARAGTLNPDSPR